MTIRKAAAIYAITIGLAISLLWLILLRTGQVPELASGPIAIRYHIFAELLLAAISLLAGYGLLAGRRWGRRVFLVAMGMAINSTINAAGYYSQAGDRSMAGILVVIGILSAAFAFLATQRGSQTYTSF